MARPGGRSKGKIKAREGVGGFLGLRPKVIPCLTGYASALRFESGTARDVQPSDLCFSII